MPRSSDYEVKHLKTKDRIFALAFVRGYSVAETAERVGLSIPRVYQILNETKADYIERVKKKYSPEESVSLRLEQLRDIRSWPEIT
jgi:transposase